MAGGEGAQQAPLQCSITSGFENSSARPDPGRALATGRGLLWLQNSTAFFSQRAPNLSYQPWKAGQRSLFM